MSKAVVVALLALVSVVCADPHLLKTHFQLFVNQYAKNYSSDAEAAFRFKVFKDNLATVALLNAGLEQPNFGVTKFSDLTAQEFKATYLRRTPHLAKLADTDKVYPRAPKSNFKRFDWRQKGAITPVKNQGTECGSCWAFSSTEVVESMWFLAGHLLTTLAPQQLVSCDQQNEGCNGGDTLPALQTIIEQGGLMAESSYPYTSAQTGENGKCKFDASKVVARVKDYMYGIRPCNDSCNHQDESALVDAVTTYGPASICISADAWQHYTGGILRATCPASADASNHCAQLVGYDKTGSTPYWIVKNQWGEDWGEDGYIYLPIGKNVCGLADEVLYAVI